MALFGLLNDKGEGTVTSDSFNLTRITAALAVLIGGCTAVSGATADAAPGGKLPDWANFTQDQRLVIIVAVVAAWAIVTASDILGRSLATVRAQSPGLVVLMPVSAQKITEEQGGLDKKTLGAVVAVRQGPPVAFLWQPTDRENPAEWVSEALIAWS